LADRTDAKVAAASTSVPKPVAREARVFQLSVVSRAMSTAMTRA
jgi:post-segregation antitoxin (ccd killing protein)